MINHVIWIGTNTSNKHPASIFMFQVEGSRLVRNAGTLIVNYNLSYR